MKLIKAYEGAYWKTFLVEADPDEAWQIGVRVGLINFI